MLGGSVSEVEELGLHAEDASAGGEDPQHRLLALAQRRVQPLQAGGRRLAGVLEGVAPRRDGGLLPGFDATPCRIGKLHRPLRMTHREGRDPLRDRTGAAVGRRESVVDDGDDLRRAQRPDLDQVGLGVERLGLIGEQHPHHRRFGAGEHQAKRLEVVLQVGAQQSGGLLHAGDAGEFVEDDHRRRVLGGAGEDLEQAVDRHQRIGSLWSRCPELHSRHAEVQRQGAGDARQALAQPAADGTERVIQADGHVGHRGDLVEVDPHDLGPGGRDVGGDPAQHAGLAVPAGPEQCRDAMFGDALDQIGDQRLPPADLVGFERPVIGKR